MFRLIMNNKGFEASKSIRETLENVESLSEKPLKSSKERQKRVDINILKSKLQEDQSKEFKKNMVIFISFLIIMGSLGIYLSI